MTLLLIGMLLFFGVHSISLINRRWRDMMAARLGAGVWMTGYSLVSAAGLILVIWGYAVARPVSPLLYSPPAGLHHLTMLALVPVFPLVVAAYLPGRIQAAARHPMLLAVILWAVAHLLSNGRLVDVLLFGGFLAWAVAVRVSLRHRLQRPMIGAPPSRLNDVIALVIGLVVYAGFVFGLHERLIGVPVP